MSQTYQHLSDEGLVRAAACGDRTAFDTIVQRYCRSLAGFAAARCRTVQDAEDIVQETFLRAFSNLTSYDPSYPFKNWLFTIAYRLIISAYRRKKPASLSHESAQETIAHEQPEQPDNEWLWNVIQTLKDDDQTVLWLRYKQDMEIEDIAKIMSVSKTSIRVKLHRARGRLVRQIDQNPDETIPWTVRKAVCSERTQ